MNFHFASCVVPGTRLVVAIAPALTMGLVRPSMLRSMAVTELKANPVALAPSFARASSAPINSQITAGADDTDTEQLTRHRRESRIDLRILPFSIRPEVGVRFVHQFLYFLDQRQMPG